MFKRRAGRLAMVLEDENVFETAILLEIDDAIAEGPEHIFDALCRHGGEGLVMIRRLDDHFVCADAIHAVVHAVRTAVQVSFDPQCRILVGNHADRPAGLVPFALPMTKGEDLRRSLGFIARTKGTESTLENYGVSDEISRSARAIGRDNDPASGDGVLPQFGQIGSSPRSEGSFYDIRNASLNRVIPLRLLSR